jgi:hypothetical protein
MSYGYAGDLTSDTNSLLGIGDRDNQLYSNPDHQSVALTEEGREERFGVTGKSTGRAFTENGHTYIDDDTAPTDFVYNGEQRHNSSGLIDVYDPSHAPDRGGLKESIPTYKTHTEEEYEAMYAPGGEYGGPPREEEPEKEPEDDTTAPLDKFRKQFPEDNNVKDDDILTGMRQRMAPNMDPEQFATLARSKNGEQAIKNEVDKGLSPLQRLRKQFPEAHDKSDDDFLLPIYNKLGSIGKLDSRVTSFDDFKEQMDPQSGPRNAIYQLWKGLSRESSAVAHEESGKAYSAVNNAKAFSDLIYQSMDTIGNQVSPGANAGTQVKKWTQQADEWLAQHSWPTGAEGSFSRFASWMNGKAQEQAKQAQVDASRAQQAGGTMGKVGRVAGEVITGTGVGLITSLIPGAPLKSAVIAASAYEGISRYGAAVQAGHDNALLEGIQGAGMGAVYRYMWDSPNGRLLTGFNLWLAGTGEDTIEKWMKGEKVDYTETAIRSGVDVLTGVLMGRHHEDLAMPDRSHLRPVEPLREPAEGQAVEPYEGDVIGIKPITPSRLHEAIPAKGTPEQMKEAVEGVKPEAQFNRPAHEMSLTYSATRDALMEEVDKAVEARKAGDTHKASEHADRALATMTPKERKQVAKRIVKIAQDAAKNNGETKADTKETNPATPEVDKASEIINSHFYGLSPRRGESGAAANPFEGKQYRPGRHNKFAQEEAAKEEEPEFPSEESRQRYLALPPEDQARYRAHGESVKRSYSTVDREMRERRGEAGYTLNWPAEIHDWLQEHLKELKVPHFQSTFEPQAASPEARAMWTASKFRTSEAQQALGAIPRKLARSLEVDKVIRGGEKSSRRERIFNGFSDAQLKEIISQAGEGDVHTGNPQADWVMNKFWKPLYAGLAQAEKGVKFDYKEIPDYIYMAVKRDGKATEDKLQAYWDKYSTSDPRWTKHRQFPTPRQLFEAGFTFVTLNPERLGQMRLLSSTQAMRKVLTLRDAVGLGGAVAKEGLSKEARKAFEGDEWTDIRAPNGEGYFVTHKAAQVVANAWERSKLYTAYWHSPLWRALSIAKGLQGRALLAFSIAHPLHVALIWPASVLTRFERMALTGERRASAWNKALTDLARSPITGFRLLDAWRGGKTDLAPDELQDLQDLKTMGLDLGINEERMMEFAQRLRELGPQWTRNAATQGAAKTLEVGYKILTTEPMMRFFFGTVIPMQKLSGALHARETLYQARPELLKPENENARKTELAKIGDQIDMRFGEVNYSNVYWSKLAKDIGQMSLLSLGWQMNLVNFIGGFAHDMTSNVAHAGELVKKFSGRKSEHTFLTDRILFTINYSAMVMAANALRQFIFTGQPPEGKDYVFPRIGKDDKGQWIRGRPIEFTSEFGVPFVSGGIWQHHIEQAGGDVALGSAQMAANKLNPVISNVIHIFQNQNFFGQEIASKLDDPGKQWGDKISWAIANGMTPIPFQALTQNTGQPFTWDVALKSMLGLPKASQWVSRTPMENLIEDTFHAEHPYGKTKEQEEIGQAHQALSAAVRDKDEKEVVQSVQNLRKMGVSDKSIKAIMKNAHSDPQNITKTHFKGLDPLSQVKILKRMSPEEVKTYLPFASKQARAQFAPAAVP